MISEWEALAKRAKIAALVLAPVGGPHTLLYLSREEDPEDEQACRELTARGLRPIAMLAWTNANRIESELNGNLLDWPHAAIMPVLLAARSEFLAALALMRSSGPTN